MKPSTRLRVRSSTLSELGDETKVNLMVGYKELIKSVNSLHRAAALPLKKMCNMLVPLVMNLNSFPQPQVFYDHQKTYL